MGGPEVRWRTLRYDGLASISTSGQADRPRRSHHAEGTSGTPHRLHGEQAIAYLRRMITIDQPSGEGTDAVPQLNRISTAADVVEARSVVLRERLNVWP